MNIAVSNDESSLDSGIQQSRNPGTNDGVPSTPPRTATHQQVPTTPLTPLSDLDTEENEQIEPVEQRTQQEQPQHIPDEEPVVDEAHIRGTNVHVPTAAAAFTDFLRNFRSLRLNGSDQSDDNDSVLSENDEASNAPTYLSRLQHLLTHGAILDNATPSATTSLDIDTMHIYYHSEACQKLYYQLVAYPMEMVPLMDIVVQRELERLAGDADASSLPRVQVRPYNLRQVSNLRELDPIALDTLVCIKGMIVRLSPVIPDLKVAHFSCAICGHDTQVTIDRGRIAEPTQRCPVCNVAAYQLIHNRCLFADKQMVRLQETPDEVPAGQTPASVTTFCFDDLVDTIQPGDKVEITGVLRAQPVRVNPKITRIKSVYKTYVDVIHFRKVTGMQQNREQPAGNGQFSVDRIRQLQQLSEQSDIYEKLTASLAPSIWELDDVKKGVLCMLFGGNHIRVKRHGVNGENGDDDDEEDTISKLHKRGDINILLCGDPGTSKSQLLKYVNKLAARGVYTSGKGSSAVGLTASVIRDPETRDLVLESGALVLSDLGICCIDEFDKMSDTTRSVLHEAMEQQTVSIAKAGILATLHARTSVLASANPTESRYNPSMSVVDNIKLPPTLLSRFDLIYLILDSPNVDHDRRLANHMVGLYYETPNIVEPPMDQTLLSDYIEYARQNIHPVLSDEAADQLMASYLELRNPQGVAYGGHGTRTISATPRQLESLIRLSEALAKMRYSRTVTRADAREAVRLMRVATQAAATDPRTGRIDMDMITTGRSTVVREQEEQIELTLKELLAERRGSRMTIRDIARQLYELTNVMLPHDQVVDALRHMEAEGVIQFHERAQTVLVRTGIVR